MLLCIRPPPMPLPTTLLPLPNRTRLMPGRVSGLVIFYHLHDILFLAFGEFFQPSSTCSLLVNPPSFNLANCLINLVLLDVLRLEKVNGVGFSLFDIFSVKIADYLTAGFMFDTLHDRVDDRG